MISIGIILNDEIIIIILLKLIIPFPGKLNSITDNELIKITAPTILYEYFLYLQYYIMLQ